MEILVAIVVIGLLAIIAYLMLASRRTGTPGRSRKTPIGRRGRGVPRNDPMAAAVADHIEATGPQEVIAAEARLKAEARRVAAPIQAEAERTEHQRAASQMADGDTYADDPRLDGYVEPAPADDDPRYDDRAR